MQRKPDWESSLSDYILQASQTRFKYGSMDCGLFVANTIQALTGIDVASVLRGQYASRLQAFKAIKSITGKASMEAIAEHLASLYGIRTIPVNLAQRGDPVLLRHGSRSSLGIVSMNGVELLTPVQTGLLRLPLSHATRAWHV